MTDFDCVVLAAGESTRMGRPKMTLHRNGMPLVVWAVQTALVNCLRVIVVEGPLPLAPLFAGRGWHDRVVVCTNREFAAGQLGSLQCGLRATQSSHVFAMLGDLPDVNPRTYQEVADELPAGEHGPTAVSIIPVTEDATPGHPVLLGPAAIRQLLAAPRGARALHIIRQTAFKTIRVTDPAISRDIDTAADLKAAGSNTQNRHQ